MTLHFLATIFSHDSMLFQNTSLMFLHDLPPATHLCTYIRCTMTKPFISCTPLLMSRSTYGLQPCPTHGCPPAQPPMMDGHCHTQASHPYHFKKTLATACHLLPHCLSLTPPTISTDPSGLVFPDTLSGL